MADIGPDGVRGRGPPRAGVGRPPRAMPIQDDWLVAGDLVAYRDGSVVRLLSLPGLSALEPLAEEEARARGLLPSGPDEDEKRMRQVEIEKLRAGLLRRRQAAP